MTTTIAVAGKGGTGKTTTTALIVDGLTRLQAGNILAIDADPSTNLNVALGVEVDQSIGDERESMMEDVTTGRYNVGLDKQQYIEMMVYECLVEEDAYDLLAMGRPEGAGCYCAPNHMLRRSIDAIAEQYAYVIMDNEAGLEHISRRTTRDVDLLLAISDPTVRGLIAAKRVFDLVGEFDERIDQAFLIINRVSVDQDGQPQLPPALASKVEELDLPLLGLLPQDPAVSEKDILGEPIASLPPDSPVRRHLNSLLAKVLPAFQAAEDTA